MFTVGSPHTWPQILGALHWMLDCVKVYIVNFANFSLHRIEYDAYKIASARAVEIIWSAACFIDVPA